MATSYMTSDDLVASVSRKISLPISQGTFSAEDILAFATEELMLSQVPSVMQFHEEYFVFSQDIPLVAGQTRYSVPERAIGMKFRDIFYKDVNGNLFEMTRITEEDKAFFQRTNGTSQTIAKYYLEGNDLVLSPDYVAQPTGSLYVSYFLRPNTLVRNARAAIITNFVKTITVNNASIVAGDRLTIGTTSFTANTDFAIGMNSATTAANLNAAIASSGIVSSSSVLANVVSVNYPSLATVITSTNSAGMTVQAQQGILCSSVPANIANGTVIDFLQTKPGHSMRKFGVTVPANGVSGNVVNFTATDVPASLVVGDYIATENESIIPQIPPDLHSGLAERTCARILAAIGDQAGLQASNAKIAEIELRQGTLLNNRVEGSLVKIRPRNSLLALGKMTRRRW